MYWIEAVGFVRKHAVGVVQLRGLVFEDAFLSRQSLRRALGAEHIHYWEGCVPADLDRGRKSKGRGNIMYGQLLATTSRHPPPSGVDLRKWGF